MNRLEQKLYPRQCTNVVFMSMGYNNCFNFVAPFLNKCCIRNNLLDTRLIIAGEASNKIPSQPMTKKYGQCNYIQSLTQLVPSKERNSLDNFSLPVGTFNL